MNTEAAEEWVREQAVCVKSINKLRGPLCSTRRKLQELQRNPAQQDSSVQSVQADRLE